MKHLWSILNKHKLLILILLISLFFRTYKIVDRFEYAHDGDLTSWFVKDVVVNHHPRLIGQLTSAPGIFIGPLYYYLVIPFYLLTKMDPIGALIPITLFGVFTTFSYFWVFKKLWNKNAGFFAAFLQSILYSWVYFDRRVVPSTPTNLWTIWYFYCVLALARGNFKILWLLGLLVGLIWHIHIALLPALAAIPIAVIVSKKLPSKKQLSHFIFAFLISNLPLLLFEARHNFSQSKSLVANFLTNHGSGLGGVEKLQHVVNMIAGNLERLFFFPHSFPGNRLALLVGAVILGVLLVHKRVLQKRDLLLLFTWALAVILFFGLSSSPLSEYYFYNIEVISVCFFVLALCFTWEKGILGKGTTLLLLGVLFFNNANYLVTQYYYQKGYNERKAVAKYIAEDSRQKGFSCVSVSYITSIGEDVGFRYFFYLNSLHVNKPISGSPVYSIVQPTHLAQGQNEAHFGQIKVIPPEKVGTKEEIEKSCMGENSNLTDPMFGFTN